MKNFFLIVCFATLATSFNVYSQQKSKVKDAFSSFGNKINADNAISREELSQKYANLKVGDTVSVKFMSKINAVCQSKGCWMKVELKDQNESFIKFKDYAFFVPKDAKDKEVIVNGKAFISEESIAEQKHYASDAGKSQAEIDKITTTKRTLSFTADGVLIKN